MAMDSRAFHSISLATKDISAQVMTVNDWYKTANVTDTSKALGTAWGQSRPTGRAEPIKIELGGVLHWDDANSIDKIVAGKFPLAPDATPDALEYVFQPATDTLTARKVECSVFVESYALIHGGDLVRYKLVLQVTGEITETLVELDE